MTGESGASAAGGAPAVAGRGLVEAFVEVDSPAVPHDKAPPPSETRATRTMNEVGAVRIGSPETSGIFRNFILFKNFLQ